MNLMTSNLSHAWRIAALSAVLAALAGCAADTPKRLGNAAVTPLNDLNVVRTDIPDVLQAAQKAPYVKPADCSCVALVLEIRQLDAALGADLDAPPTEKTSLFARAPAFASDQAVGALQRTAQDLVPLRGWVRKLSGAERHSQQVAAAIAAGSARRGFLKGVAAAQNCLWQTVPTAVPKPDDAVAQAPN
jgi:hypothetical protein